jgi:putative transposase
MFVQHSTQYKDVPGWGLSDSFWERIKPLIPKPKSRLRGRGKYRKHIGGRPSAEPRHVMAGILYVLRTGCQWNAVPREYGSGKTMHRYFQRWTRVGAFKKRWKRGLCATSAISCR